MQFCSTSLEQHPYFWMAQWQWYGTNRPLPLFVCNTLSASRNSTSLMEQLQSVDAAEILQMRQVGLGKYMGFDKIMNPRSNIIQIQTRSAYSKCSLNQAYVACTYIPITRDVEAGGSFKVSLSCTVRHIHMYILPRKIFPTWSKEKYRKLNINKLNWSMRFLTNIQMFSFFLKHVCYLRGDF